METKGYCLPFKDKQDISDGGDTSNCRYNNLNFNQNYQYLSVDIVRSKNVISDNGKVQKYYGDFDGDQFKSEHDSKRFDKASKNLSYFDNIQKNNSDELKERNKSKSVNTSTLSLHIAAYENSVETNSDSINANCADSVGLSQNKDLVIKWKNSYQIFTDPTSIIQNPFEFPRQPQENEGITKPEIAEFKASQNLLNPNQLSPTLNNQLVNVTPASSNHSNSNDDVFYQQNNSKNNDQQNRHRFYSGSSSQRQSFRSYERRKMSPDSSSRRSHESNEGSSRSRRRSSSITKKRRKYSPSSRRSRSNSPSRTSTSRRKYHESTSTNGRSSPRTSSSRRSPEHYSNRKRSSYRSSNYSSSHYRRSPLPSSSSSRRDSDRYHRNSSSSINRKPSPPAERRDRKKSLTKNEGRSRSREPRSRSRSPPRRSRAISTSSSSSPSPSPPPFPVISNKCESEEIDTKNEALVTQTLSAIDIKPPDTNNLGYPSTFGLAPPMPPPPFFNYGVPPPPFYMIPPPPIMPQLNIHPNGMFYPVPPPNFPNSMYPFTPPPPPPPPIPIEEEAPGTSVVAIPVPIQSSKYLYMPERPKIKGKVALPKVADDWGHGRIKDYEILKAVGEGTYGKVFKAKHRSTGTLVALKKVRLENERDGFPITAVREIKILRQLDHENVVRLLDVAIEGPKDDPDGPLIDSFYLVFEYMAHDLHGLVDSKIVDFTHEQLSSMVKQLLLGLEHCHTKNFLHRDIKCSNILLNNKGQIKLADFGLARLYHKSIDRLYTNRVITLWYRPPELLLGLEKYGPAVDIWSIGCIIGELFLKRPIFTGQTEQNMLEIISSICGTPSPENWPGVEKLPLWKNITLKQHPRVVKDYFRELPSIPLDLLDSLLSLDPSKRLTATAALNHPWLKRINIDQIPGPELPENQDCHEMWSKKIRKSGLTFPTKDTIPSQPVPPYSNNGNGRTSSQSSYTRRQYP